MSISTRLTGSHPRRIAYSLLGVLSLLLSQVTANTSGVLPVAHAATAWYVASNGTDPASGCGGNSSTSPYQHIQTAINCAAGGDSINIASGTFSEQLTIATNLTLTGAGAATTAIDGANGGTVITVSGGTTVSLAGLTIQHGAASSGGGINSAGTLTLSNVVVTSNTAASNGAGIYAAAGAVTTISNSSITANTIDSSSDRVVRGGGIYNLGTLTIDRSTIANNLVKTDLSPSGGSGAAATGGGIDNAGTAQLAASTVSGNTAWYPDANVGSTCSGPGGCFGEADGAGIMNESTGTLAVVNTTISGNSISTSDGNGLGGGIRSDGTVSLTASTIANNTVTVNVGPANARSFAYGGGLAVDGPASNVSLRATILANNTLSPGNYAGNFLAGADCSTNFAPAGISLASQGYNLILDTSSCTIDGNTTSNITGEDPQLGSLQNNGGPTQTMLPTSGSPAIGAGSCADSSNNPISIDQRGVSRPVSACTIGAVEADLANDTWTSALTLNQASGSYQVNQTVSQSIYASTQERWYKFLITPGSSVHVQYSGRPGAVLSLHSDLQSEYSSLTNPQSAALESAKDAPSAFLPSAFLPSAFLPSAFLPSAFLPSAFLPSAFLPSAFLPSAFLPSAFLPSAFLPSAFLPSAFLPGPYSGAIYASLLAVSATPNSSVQTIDHNTWNSFGYMYVRVTAPANASTPFNLTVTESGGICAGVTVMPVTPPSASGIPTGLKSLILWDPSRITGSTSDISTLGTKLSNLASQVQGSVVDLSSIPGLDGSSSAQQQADNNPACPTAKNIVANDIKSVVQAYRAQNPGLQYVVLIGDDRAIPFFRYADESGLAPENQYYPPTADSSTSNASLRNNLVLGQDEYGASLDLPQSDVSLPIPDLAVGRLVRTAAEVSHMIDVYTAANGTITPSSSLVTGYDFVADAASNAQVELQAGTNATPDTLISPQGQSPSASWTANDLRQKLLGSRHDVVFLAGHFSAGNLEAADYATTLGAAEVASSTVDMSNSLILALGCHGGYNIPGGDAVPKVSPAPDWPEAMAEKGATLLAASGYAYGDTVLTAYGEHLFDNYVRQLRSYSGAGYVPVAVGQANVAAKREYLATHTNLTGIDEKTLLETTLYGLPMLQVNMSGQHVSSAPDSSIVASAPTVSSGPGQQLGLAVGQTNGGSQDIDVQPTLTSHTVPLTNSATNAAVAATYLTGPNNGEVARPGEPIFPLQLFNVHVSNQILRGVGFRGGSYSDTPHVTLLTSAASTETSVGHPAFYSSILYPTQVWSANYLDAINGGPERLVTTPAQYISTSTGSTDGTLRQFGDLKFRLFYLPSNWTTTPTSNQAQAAVAAPPKITSATATTDSSGNVTFNVHVLSDQAAGTQGVWITYTDTNHPGMWLSVDLNPNGTDPTLWTATQSLPSSIVFMVQAVNGTGLVSLDTNSGAFYTVGSSTQPAVSTPTTVTVQAATSTGIYQATSGTFQVQLQAAGSSGPTPLSGQMVTLQLGSQQAFATTDANGNASITVPLNQSPGSYTTVATFAGSSAQGTIYQASSSAPGTFAITPAPTTLSLAPSPANANYGGPWGITATLTTTPSGGQPQGLAQKTVYFTVSGNGFIYQKSVITDYQGRAQLPALPLPAGTYMVAVSFAQPVTLANGGILTSTDNTYQPSSAQTALTIQLFTPGTFLIPNQSGTNCHLLLNGGTLTAGTVSVDGTSSSALCINSGSLSARSIIVQGGVFKNGGALNGKLSVHQPATPDLLASLPAPSAPGAACPGASCPDGTNLNSGHTYRLLPGTYTQTLNVNSGATVCAAPGIYVLQASWNVNAAVLRPFGSPGCPVLPAGTTDPGVLLYFQQGALQLNSGASVTQLSAPRMGPYAGLLYWQVGNAATAINGSAAGGGAWYEPAGTLILNGGARLTAPMVTAASITVNGGATLSVTGP